MENIPVCLAGVTGCLAQSLDTTAASTLILVTTLEVQLSCAHGEEILHIFHDSVSDGTAAFLMSRCD